MTPKERVIAQITHKETDFIPYNLFFEEESDKTLIEQGALILWWSWFSKHHPLWHSI